MRTVGQLELFLAPYISVGTQSYATTTLKMLNHVLPRLYAEGDYKALKTTYEVDASSGYFCLLPDHECVLSATLQGVPMYINSFDYPTQIHGPGEVTRPVGHQFGLIDKGMVTLMSDLPELGADEFIFSCASASFASGDTATITYTDTDQGYTQVVLPLQTITVAAAGVTAINTADDAGTDDVTGLELTDLTVTSSAGLVAGLGLQITKLTAGDLTYSGTFRIHSVPDATSVIIEKGYVALTGTLAAVSVPRLMPVSTIESVESITYTSLPGRTVMKDADGIIYGVYLAGDGASSFRRYDVPQVPADGVVGEWDVIAIVKRAFLPLTASTDYVYLDNLPALTAAFLAVVARDAGDHERERRLWEEALRILDKELFNTRGGVQEMPYVELWGTGIPGLPTRY